MEKLKLKALQIRKAPILVPLVVLILVLGGYTFLQFRGVSAASSLTLGQQYLNDLNYGGAIAAFTQAIELDPGSSEARIGLAQAYAGTEDYDVARQVLEDLVYTQRPDEEAVNAMVEILQQTGQLSQAAQLTQTLITTTDKDAYYAKRDEILTQLYAAPRSYAVGTDQQLVITNGQVQSLGSNTLGQLGTDPALVAASENYQSAGFPGTARKVICVGRTSFVVDDSGALWAAGENRWGQMGGGYAVTAPEGGWVQVDCPGPVADVAGTTGRLLVLLTDGSLWTVGAGSGQTLTPLTRFPVVIQIASNGDKAAVLTADGALYTSSSGTPDQWSLYRRDAAAFTLSDTSLFVITTEGRITSDSYYSDAPLGWTVSPEDGALQPDCVVTAIANAGSRILFTTADGQLCTFRSGGDIQEVESGAAVTALYPQGEVVVVEYDDGTARYWGEDTSAAQALI